MYQTSDIFQIIPYVLYKMIGTYVSLKHDICDVQDYLFQIQKNHKNRTSSFETFPSNIFEIFVFLFVCILHFRTFI